MLEELREGIRTNIRLDRIELLDIDREERKKALERLDPKIRFLVDTKDWAKRVKPDHDDYDEETVRNAQVRLDQFLEIVTDCFDPDFTTELVHRTLNWWNTTNMRKEL